MGAFRVPFVKTFLSKNILTDSLTAPVIEGEPAQLKAEKMAQAVRAKAGRVLSLKEESSFNQSRPYEGGSRMMMKAAYSADASAAPSVDARQQELQMSVFAEFAIE